MTTTMKKLATALLAAATLATIAPTGNAVAASLVKGFPHLNGGLVGKQVVGTPPVVGVHGIREIEGPRRLRAWPIVIGIDGGYHGGYHGGCYWRFVRYHLVKICPDYDLD